MLWISDQVMAPATERPALLLHVGLVLLHVRPTSDERNLRLLAVALQRPVEKA